MSSDERPETAGTPPHPGRHSTPAASADTDATPRGGRTISPATDPAATPATGSNTAPAAPHTAPPTDPDLLAATGPDTAASELEALADRRPDLRARIAMNPSAPAPLLARLAFLGDPEVHRALRRRAGVEVEAAADGGAGPQSAVEDSAVPTTWTFTVPPAPGPAVDAHARDADAAGAAAAADTATDVGLLPDRLPRVDASAMRMTAPRWVRERTAAPPSSSMSAGPPPIALPSPGPSEGRPRPRARRALAALGAAALATITVASAWAPVEGADGNGLVSPSPAWARGGHQAWSVPGTLENGYNTLTVSPSGDRVARIHVPEDGMQMDVSTYTMAADGARLLWSGTVPRPGDATGDPQILTAWVASSWWGDRLVVGTQVVDPEAGTVSAGPWRDANTASVSVSGGTWAVACTAESTCTAWDADGTARWTRHLDGSPLDGGAVEDGRWWTALQSRTDSLAPGAQILDLATGDARDVRLTGARATDGGDEAGSGDEADAIPSDAELARWGVYVMPERNGWLAQGISPSGDQIAYQALTPSGEPTGPLVLPPPEAWWSGMSAWAVTPGGPQTAEDLLASLVADGGRLRDRERQGAVVGRLGTAPCTTMTVGRRTVSFPDELASWSAPADAFGGPAAAAAAATAAADPSDPSESGDAAACAGTYGVFSASADGSVVTSFFAFQSGLLPRMAALDVRGGRFTWVSDELTDVSLARPDLVVAMTGTGELVGYAPGP